MTVLLISGSRDANYKMLEYVDFSLKEAIKYGWSIMVGDNPKGVDLRVLAYCNSVGYKDICVVSVASEGARSIKELNKISAPSRSTAQQYAKRDRFMADMADRGLFIWNGTSPGTLAVYEYMLSIYKPVTLANFAKPTMKLKKEQLKRKSDSSQLSLF